MTVHLCTFATDDMSRSRELCAESALRHGCDTANGWSLSYLKHFPSFREGWTTARGFGWWHWKPIVIQQALHEHLTNDIVMWADAGVEFIAPVSHIIERMDQDIFLFGNNWEHAHWCKRDTVETIWPWWERGRNLNMDAERIVNVFVNGEPYQRQVNTRELAWERFGKQAQASVIFLRVSDYTRQFVKEWLDWCLFDGGRLIDDSPSRLPNHPEFQEHRHDQAILTIMAYREGLRLHYWPAMYNDGAFSYEKLPCYAGDDYPILFHHHRRRDHEWA